MLGNDLDEEGELDLLSLAADLGGLTVSAPERQKNRASTNLEKMLKSTISPSADSKNNDRISSSYKAIAVVLQKPFPNNVTRVKTPRQQECSLGDSTGFISIKKVEDSAEKDNKGVRLLGKRFSGKRDEPQSRKKKDHPTCEDEMDIRNNPIG
jgi:hypothetical protein